MHTLIWIVALGACPEPTDFERKSQLEIPAGKVTAAPFEFPAAELPRALAKRAKKIKNLLGRGKWKPALKQYQRLPWNAFEDDITAAAARRDLVRLYARVGDIDDAAKRFGAVGDGQHTREMLTELAAAYRGEHAYAAEALVWAGMLESERGSKDEGLLSILKAIALWRAKHQIDGTFGDASELPRTARPGGESHSQDLMHPARAGLRGWSAAAIEAARKTPPPQNTAVAAQAVDVAGLYLTWFTELDADHLEVRMERAEALSFADLDSAANAYDEIAGLSGISDPAVQQLVVAATNEAVRLRARRIVEILQRPKPNVPVDKLRNLVIKHTDALDRTARLTLVPQPIEMYLNLGRLHALMGQPADARRMFLIVLGQDPNSEEACDARTQIMSMWRERGEEGQLKHNLSAFSKAQMNCSSWHKQAFDNVVFANQVAPVSRPAPPPPPQAEQVQCKDGPHPNVDPAALARRLGPKIAELRGCLEQGLMKAPKLEGTVNLSFQIDRRGRAKRVKAKASGAPLRKTAKCVQKAVRRWSLVAPKNRGKATVKTAIGFAPASAGG